MKSLPIVLSLLSVLGLTHAALSPLSHRKPLANTSLSLSDVGAHTSTCCGTNVGYTYDRCTLNRICASPRYCVNIKSGRGCSFAFQEDCHCVPIVMIPCARSDHCAQPFETCAYLPGGSPYCYSAETVKTNSSFNFYEYTPQCCGEHATPTPSPSHPPTESHPPKQSASPSPMKSYPPKPSASHPAESQWPGYSYSNPPDPTYHVYTESPTPTKVTVPPPTPGHSKRPKPSSGGTPSPSPSKPVVSLVPKPSLYPSSGPYTPSPSPSGGGLSGDPCDPGTPGSCKGYRECTVPSSCPTLDCNGVCIWSTLCTCTSDCYHGEICVSSDSDDSLRFCYSPFRVVDIPWVKVHHCSESGMTGDGCIDDSYCKGGRKCVQGGRSECIHGLVQCGLDRPECDAENPYDCYCSGVRYCSCESGCEDSEVCCDTPHGHVCLSRNSVSRSVQFLQCPVPVNASGNSTTDMYQAPKGSLYAIGETLTAPSASPAAAGQPTPVSGPPAPAAPTVTTSTTTTTSPTSSVEAVSTVCVDARALAHLDADDLVFRRHVRGAVLCDPQGSCATPGHMVTFRNRPMMMATYCRTHGGGCTRRTMLVNSPKYRIRLHIESNTDGLRFTALAARFESRSEEVLLSAAVHIGL